MIINLTQHVATEEQRLSGVIDSFCKDEVRRLLTFTSLPMKGEIVSRAEALAEIAASSGAPAAMVGGAPYLMAPLERALKAKGITPLYAYSERVSEEHTNENGEVVKVNKFVHKGFVEV